MRNLEELYRQLLENCQNGILVLERSALGYAFFHLTDLLSVDTLRIEKCALSMGGGRVLVQGTCRIPDFDSFGSQSILAGVWVEEGTVCYEVKIEVNGCGRLADLCNTAEEILLSEEHLLAGFQLSFPEVLVYFDRKRQSPGYSISGTAHREKDSRLQSFSMLLPETMPFQGVVVQGKHRYVQINFQTGRKYSFPLGEADVGLAMRTLHTDHLGTAAPKVLVWLLFALEGSGGRKMTFQMGVPLQRDSYDAVAFFTPVLSLENVVLFLGDLFGWEPEQLFLPEGTPLSAFGLQKIFLRLRPRGETIMDGLDISYVETTFRLDKPWETPIAGLELTDFTVFFEMSQTGRRRAASLTVSAAAVLQLGKYKIRGRVKGYFPYQYYEGALALYRDGNRDGDWDGDRDGNWDRDGNGDGDGNQDGDGEMTLGDLAEVFHAPAPGGTGAWDSPLADFSIEAQVPARRYCITASARDILSFQVGKLRLSVDYISVSAEVQPSGNSFTFEGILGFETGPAGFGMRLLAQYREGWVFSAALSEGGIDLAGLIGGIFGVKVSEEAAKVVVDDLSVSYAFAAGEFYLYASFGVFWFTVLGCTPSLGGRIKLLKKADDSFSASALFYLDAFGLNFLVQADDFHTDHMSLLFRVSFRKFYLQGTHFKERGDEIVTLSLGGMTLGELVLAFVHMLNPNAKSALSAPWNVLDKINLSDFFVVINATRGTVSVLYHVGISIAGLMQIEDVGIRYDGKKVRYLLTGRLLDKTYTAEDPVSWDALDGAPPANAASGDTKTKISYIGLGSHLAADVGTGSIAEAVEKLKAQIVPVDPEQREAEFSYSSTNRWMFGADVTIGDLFRLQAVLVDPQLYGVRIVVKVSEKSPLRQFNGLEAELLYQKISDRVGMFRCTLTLPKKMSRFDLGAVAVTIGQISLEIYTNGSFLIDLGFPHGGDFSRSFGLEYGIFTGRGGLYFGVLEGDAVKNVPKIKNGAFTPVVLMGLGLSVGLGRSFDLGIVRGGVSLTVTGILEGVFAVFHPADENRESAVYYKVSACAGISGTLFLSVDLKVIAFSVSAAVSAMCDVVIESYRKSLVRLTLSLKLAASIRILFIKIDFSFQFHQEVEFTFGSDSAAPWELAEEADVRAAAVEGRPGASAVSEGRSGALDVRAAAVGGKSRDWERRSEAVAEACAPGMFPSGKIGFWSVGVSVLPLFSVLYPMAERGTEPDYCVAFLCVVSPEDFAKLAEMLLFWILAGFGPDALPGEPGGVERSASGPDALPGESGSVEQSAPGSREPGGLKRFTREQADSIPPKAEEALSLGDFDRFFSENLQVTVSPEVRGAESGSAETGSAEPGGVESGSASGVYFPMLHQLSLGWNGGTVRFDENLISEEYSRRISEYLSRLNSDPCHRISEGDGMGPEIPMAGAITADYFQMILSQLTAGIRRLFAGFPVRVESFAEIEERYGTAAGELLASNPKALLSIEYLPHYTYVIQKGDTLRGIQAAFALTDAQLWQDLAEVSRVPAWGEEVVLRQYSFDNTRARMTVLEAAAVFFVRLYRPEVFYNKYADRIMEENHLGAEWRCREPYGRSLAVPGWHGEYVALAGDTVPYVAKAAALVNGECAEGWEAFRNRFLEDNGSASGDCACAYMVNASTVIQDNTLAELAGRICPDFTGISGIAFLWEQPVLAPLQDVLLTDAAVGLGPVTAAQSGISLSQLGEAAQAGGVRLAGEQELTVKPAFMDTEELCGMVLGESGTVGAMVSRFFLQGLRIPSREGCVRPLFELLGQQAALGERGGGFAFWLEGREDCGWIRVLPERAELTAGELLAQLPDGVLPVGPVPERTEDFAEQAVSWSVWERNGVQGDHRRYFLAVLPQDLRRYLGRYGAKGVAVSCDGEEVSVPGWASLMEFPVIRKGEGVCYFLGASPEDRRQLYRFLTARIREVRILYRVSRLETELAEYAELSPGHCLLVRSDLSTETHMGMEFCAGREEVFENIASLDQPGRFLLLAWECSVIGGGFWLSCEGIPEGIFDAQGRGSIYLLTCFEEGVFEGSCGNRVVLEQSFEQVVFRGEEERKYVPVLPVGNVGFYAPVDVSEENKMQNLFQTAGYTAETAEGAVESMPVLPQQQPDGTAAYRGAVPLYRLCGDGVFPYSGVGQRVLLRFFRRDVLGNTGEWGTVSLTGTYNDLLSGVNQIPCTEASYLVRRAGEGVILSVSFAFAMPGREEITQGMLAQALKCMQQAACADMEISVSSTLDQEAVYRLDGGGLSAYRAYTAGVYQALSGGPAQGAQGGLAASFMLELKRIPREIFPVSAEMGITRTSCSCAYEGVRSVSCPLLRGEHFEAEFQKAVPEILLASDSGGTLYGVPRGTFLDRIGIKPFSYRLQGEEIRSPEFYSVPPFSVKRITRSVWFTRDGREEEAVYTDIDLEVWIRRFLGDLEALLSGEEVSRGAVLCPREVDGLIQAKGVLAGKFAGRLVPLSRVFSGEGASAAEALCGELFRKSLDNVCLSDVVCVYRAEYGESGHFRLESALSGSGAEGLHAGKADSENKYFCLFSRDNRRRSTGTQDLKLSFPHLEYQIKRDPLTGYEDSAWLRLLTPLTEEDPCVEVDLCADLGIPHPLKLFPDGVRILSQSYDTDDSPLLKYRYMVRLAGKLYEQQVVCLELSFGRETVCACAGGRDLFDILAEYDRRREEILRLAADGGSGAGEAYAQMEAFAREFASAMEVPLPESGRTGRGAGSPLERGGRAGRGSILLKLCAAFGGEASLTVEIDDESRRVMEELGIALDHAEIASGGAGEDGVVEVRLSGLPIYECTCVRPCAWVIQNENLFSPAKFPVNPAFLFRTQESSADVLRVRAEYGKREFRGDTDFARAAAAVWELLELNRTASAPSVAVSLCYGIAASGTVLPLRLPAVFLPQAPSPGAVSDALARWSRSAGRGGKPLEVVFQVDVYGAEGYDALMSAEVVVTG